MGKRTRAHHVTVVLSAAQLIWVDRLAAKFSGQPSMALFKKDGSNQPWTRAGVLRHLVEIAMQEHPT